MNVGGGEAADQMVRETRDLRVFPMTPEQYKQFQKHAKKQKILFSAIKDKDGKGKLIDVVLPVTELDRLKGFRAQLDNEGRSVPSKTKSGGPKVSKGR